jgi:glutathione S-transferase
VYELAFGLDTADRIELQTVVVAPVKYSEWSDDVSTVAKSNLIATISTLVLGNNGDGVYDSKAICDILEDGALVNKRSDLQPHDWRLKTLHSWADGFVDAQVLILYEENIRAGNHISHQTWIHGQTEKIMRGFDRFELEVGRGTLQVLANDTPAGAAECAVAARVAFLGKLGSRWRGKRPQVVVWF